VTDTENDVTVQPAPANTKTRPLLTPALMARLRAYGSPERVGAGDLIYQADDDNYDLILIESGRVDLLSDPATGQAPSLIAEMGPGDFLGEISLFTGERMFLTACARGHHDPPHRRRRVPAIDGPGRRAVRSHPDRVI
jgi:CRP-like cAMP-binding protein